uniref:DNA polymerase kappa n=1 Tax=Trypanosoma congolense (strain IL3000) TaxID=1068625 RepID=G0V1C2_TRYCI|nr:unnamed protein product [Trypanosoma congolense IL3000]
MIRPFLDDKDDSNSKRQEQLARGGHWIPDDMCFMEPTEPQFVIDSESVCTEPAAMLQSGPVGSSFELTLDCTKAGMERVDKRRVESIIRDTSRDSDYFLNERRKAEGRQKQVQELRRKSATFAQLLGGERNAAQRKQWEQKVSKIEQELEATRNLGTYVHLDMDMFFAAVEIKKNPAYAEVPLGVGTMTMLSTTNYIARSYGVRAAIPGFIGMKLCRNLVIVPPDFKAYRAESAIVHRIASEYDPDCVSVGMDELTLEVSDYLSRQGGTMTAVDVATELRARVFRETQLTSSAGIGPTAALAKIASNYNKPNGQYELRLHTREDVMRYVRDLPLRAAPGIGKAMENTLKGLDINTLGDIYERRVELCYVLTEKLYRFLLGNAIGVMSWPCSCVAPAYEFCDRTLITARKSVGSERAFSALCSKAELKEVATTIFQAVYDELRANEWVCRQVSLRIRWPSFRIQQFTKSLPQHSDDHSTLNRALGELLLPHVSYYASMRLLGIRLLDLVSKKEYLAKQRGGVQKTLSQFCTPRSTEQNPATPGVKRMREGKVNEEEKESVEINVEEEKQNTREVVEIFVSSQESSEQCGSDKSVEPRILREEGKPDVIIID